MKEAEEASGDGTLVLFYSAMPRDRKSNEERKVKLNILK